MKLFLFSMLISTSVFAELSKCEQKIQDLMMAAEKINYPQSAQSEFSKFTMTEEDGVIKAQGVVLVYNGDTIYRTSGHRLLYGDPKDCVIKELTVEVLP